MSNQIIGSQSPAKKVSWLKRDVLLFNVSIGCTEPQFLYERHKDFAAFPTYPLALVFKQNNQEVIDFYSAQDSPVLPGGLKLDTKHLVDGQRAIQMLKPLPITSEGHDFELHSKVLGMYDKGSSGTVVKSEDALVDAGTGEVYARIIGSMFYVGQGNWGGPRGDKEPDVPRPDSRPDDAIEFEVPKNASHLYRLNGDYNPLHATPEVGKEMGFGGIITHGVYTYNRIAQHLVQSFADSDPSRLREFQAKFTSVVKPGDHIRIDVWRQKPDLSSWEDIIWIATVIETGQVCLSDGKASIRTMEPTGSAAISKL